MIEHFKNQVDAGYKKLFYITRTKPFHMRGTVEIKHVDIEMVEELNEIYDFYRYNSVNNWPEFTLKGT